MVGMMDEFDLLLLQIMRGEFVSTYLIAYADGIHKVGFKCQNNRFRSKETFSSPSEAAAWRDKKMAYLEGILSELGYRRQQPISTN